MSRIEATDGIIREAREAHTKAAWDTLIAKYKILISSSTNSRLIAELFRMLAADPQCLHYNEAIWEALLLGCLSSWNLELGQEIVRFLPRTATAGIAIAAARIHLESGHPTNAREYAKRALRLAKLQDGERLRLEMLICNSFIEDRKPAPARRLLAKMTASLQTMSLADSERAELLVDIARTHFFLGRYPAAAKFFYDAYELYRDIKDWEAAAKAVFNAAACYHNAGAKSFDNAYALVEECRKIAEAHNLPGPLAHCEAFYGTADYHLGNFAGAREHYRKALEFLPASDKSFRRLHILSMLSFTYLRTGKFALAHRFGQQTLDLAQLDESDRFKSRYEQLHSELLWEDGRVEESQDLLRKSITHFLSRGNVQTLEELSEMGRYLIQAAWLGEATAISRIKIVEQLKKHASTWLQFLYGLGQQELFSDNAAAALKIYNDNMLPKARAIGDNYHLSLALLGKVQALLALHRPNKEINDAFKEFEVVTARMIDTPLKATAKIILAALAYRGGDFVETERHLRNALRLSYISFVDRFCVETWIATIEGKSTRLTTTWQQHLLANLTRIYFSPSLRIVSERHFLVSDHFEVSLEKHPALADLLHHILTRASYTATGAELQTNVWQQSLNQQGWQQKIRNTIMRLRDFFPYTLAPLILHTDNVRLYSEAIRIHALPGKDHAPEDEILRLLRDGPLSSVQLSNRMNISAATTKRILKRLTENRNITVMKVGRNIFYQTIDMPQRHLEAEI